MNIIAIAFIIIDDVIHFIITINENVVMTIDVATHSCIFFHFQLLISLYQFSFTFFSSPIFPTVSLPSVGSPTTQPLLSILSSSVHSIFTSLSFCRSFFSFLESLFTYFISIVFFRRQNTTAGHLMSGMKGLLPLQHLPDIDGKSRSERRMKLK